MSFQWGHSICTCEDTAASTPNIMTKNTGGNRGAFRCISWNVQSIIEWVFTLFFTATVDLSDTFLQENFIKFCYDRPIWKVHDKDGGDGYMLVMSAMIRMVMMKIESKRNSEKLFFLHYQCIRNAVSMNKDGW